MRRVGYARGRICEGSDMRGVGYARGRICEGSDMRGVGYARGRICEGSDMRGSDMRVSTVLTSGVAISRLGVSKDALAGSRISMAMYS